MIYIVRLMPVNHGGVLIVILILIRQKPRLRLRTRLRLGQHRNHPPIAAVQASCCFPKHERQKLPPRRRARGRHPGRLLRADQCAGHQRRRGCGSRQPGSHPRAAHRRLATNRQTLVLQRAKECPGDYDIEFIGDSITQGWEGDGKNVWKELYGKYKMHQHGRQRRPHRTRPLAF